MPFVFSRVSLRSPRWSWVLPLALAAALVVPLMAVGDRLLRSPNRAPEVWQVPTSRAFRALSPGAQLSIANYYWLVTIQYIGDQALRNGRFEQLYDLAELVTDLDPQHGYAYQTAGIALSGVGRLEQSDAILKKGIERGPRWWSFPYYLAFNSFFYRGDYATAARWAEMSARTPGASTNISKLALALDVKAGSPDVGVEFIEEMRRSAKDEQTLTLLDEQYRLALLARDFARLDAAVDRFRAERGRDPRSLRELVAAGILDAIPRDPYGGTYVWRDGAVHSTAKDFRFTDYQPGKPRRPAPPPEPKGVR